MTEIINENDIDKLNDKAGEIIARAIKKTAEKKGYAVLAIVGGRSVSGVFYKLKNLDIPWEKVHIFMADERLVPLDHKESNFRLAEEKFIIALAAKGILPRKNVHPFIMDNSHDDDSIKAYEAELKKHGGRFDVLILSSGEDGHVGALYPDHHSVRDDSVNFIIIHDSPKMPKDRMTAARRLMQIGRASCRERV